MNGIGGKTTCEPTQTLTSCYLLIQRAFRLALAPNHTKYGIVATILWYGQTRSIKCFTSIWDTTILIMNTKPTRSCRLHLPAKYKTSWLLMDCFGWGKERNKVRLETNTTSRQCDCLLVARQWKAIQIKILRFWQRKTSLQWQRFRLSQSHEQH